MRVLTLRLERFIPILIVLLSVANSARAQAAPVDVSVCELAKHPKTFDKKLIRVRGTLNANFEDSTLATPGCNTEQGIWLAFGGDVPGLVASTVNDNFRTPGVDLKVDGTSYGIKKDENLRRLYSLLAVRKGDKPVFRVTATVAGTFFAGEENKLSNGITNFRGYGHLGCCALFVITQVSDVNSVPPANLNVRGIVLLPDGKAAAGFHVMNDVLGGLPPVRQQTTTNASGYFDFSDSGQLLRFEDPKFRPMAVSAKLGGPPVHVKLEPAVYSDWIVPPCDPKGNSTELIGFSVLFLLPSGMKAGPYENGDYRSFFIFPVGSDMNYADLIIDTGTEPVVETEDGFVLSDRSEQRWIKDNAGNVIGIDARGHLKGRYWRRATFSGHDAAGYMNGRGKRPNPLDKMIDSACLANP